LKRKRWKVFIFVLGVVVLGLFIYHYRYGETTIPEIVKDTYTYSSVDSLTAGYVYVIKGEQQVRINLLENEAKMIIDALKETVVHGTEETYSPEAAETNYLVALEDPKMQTENITFSIYYDHSKNKNIIYPFIVSRFKPEQYIPSSNKLMKTLSNIVSEKASLK